MEGRQKRVPFADAPLQIIDGDRGKAYPSRQEFRPTGYCLFLNTGNVTASGFNFCTCDYISEERDKLLRKGRLVRGDIVLTTRGTVGNVAFFDEHIEVERIRINSGMVIFRCEAAQLLPDYLFHFLRSRDFREQVDSLVTGSAQPQLPIKDIEQIQIPIPSLTEQKRIVSIINGFERRLHSNIRMCRILEEMAQALFKSWFVDFDPVVAKSEGGKPFGMSDEIAALFPNSFQESELGPIPKGWEVIPLARIARLVKGRSYKSSELSEGSDTALVTLKSFSRGGGYKADGLKGYNGSYREDQVVHPGSVAVAITDVTQNAEVIGRAVRVTASKRFRQLVASLDTVVVSPDSHVTNEWIYLKLRTQEYVDWILGFANGTTVLHLDLHGLEEFPLVIPPTVLMDHFQKVAKPLLDKADALNRESTVLSECRNALLPRLLSGEIIVGGQHQVIQETVAA